ncbi:MAG: helix-turn-helix transcriptional regulator, partial [Ruminococcus sp.]|nr:helix-turn-helix transcriptional regulator [Ruminococcus sp.]
MDFLRITNNEKYQRVGLNIAYQRKLKNITQVQLAEKIGVSRTHMSNIEAPNMITSIALEVIFNIADVLEIPDDILFKVVSTFL